MGTAPGPADQLSAHASAGGSGVAQMEYPLFTPDYVRDPYPVYDRLRAEAPVYRDPVSGLWLLTRMRDVRPALADHGRFSSQVGSGPEDPERILILVNDDPPRHDELRALASPFFGRHQLNRLTQRIDLLAETLVEGLAPDDVEVMTHLAIPLPVYVITEILGVPAGDRGRFLGMRSPDPSRSLAEREAEFESVVLFLQWLVRQRRAEPTDDLISHLLHGAEGVQLEEWEIISFCIVLLVAGNETTSNLIGNLLHHLGSHPELWDRLRGSPSGIAAAVDEMVRFECPAQVVFRRTRQAVEIEEVEIPEGEVVGLVVGAANRDHEAFVDADRFDIERRTAHVGFGYGIHGCIGGPLAHLEASALLRILVQRFPSLRLRGMPLRQVASPFVLGFETLPVTFAGSSV